MTECTQESFAFEAHFSRRVEAGFTGGAITSAGGAMLLRAVAGKLNMFGRLGGCFRDERVVDRVEHSLESMLRQRIFALAMDYEDLNDHKQLRRDPLFGVLSGKHDLAASLAGKSTLNRIELSRESASCTKSFTAHAARWKTASKS